jgi:hypothetical protein
MMKTLQKRGDYEMLFQNVYVVDIKPQVLSNQG